MVITDVDLEASGYGSFWSCISALS